MNQRFGSSYHLKSADLSRPNRLRIDSSGLWFCSDCWSIENRFGCSLVASLICWSIENRFKCSLVASLIADRLRIDSIALWLPLWLLIDWESIRLLSGCHSDCWSIENRFKILHQTSKCRKIFIRCPNEVIQKPIIIIFARRTKWRNPFFSIPWYAKRGG